MTYRNNRIAISNGQLLNSLYYVHVLSLSHTTNFGYVSMLLNAPVNKDKDPIAKFHAIEIFSSILICFGISTIIGLYGHIDALIRYEPGTIAIVFNTAISFVLLALGILCQFYKLPKISIAFSLLVLLIGFLVLVKHIFAINLGIDQLFFKHYDSIANKYPGRMAPNSALGIILGSSALLLITSTTSRFCFVLGTLLTTLIFSLAIVFFTGYLIELDFYKWGSVTPMSIPAAIGFILLSINLILSLWHKSWVMGYSIVKPMPLIVTFSFFVATCIITIKVGQHEAMINHTSHHTPVIIFIIGCFFSLASGLVLHSLQIAWSSAQNAKRAISILRSTLEATADGILVMNLDGDIITYNQKFVEMWDLPTTKVSTYSRLSLTQAILDRLNNKEKYYLSRKNLILHPLDENIDEMHLKNGNILERHIKPQYLDNKIIGRVCSYRDVTLQKRLETQLPHQTTYDNLTGLPNRALLLDLINRFIKDAKQESSVVGIFLIDIDKFSQINDLFGRSKGDALLKDISARLKEYLPSGCTFGRIGGDEFLVIATKLIKKDSTTRIIDKIISSMAAPFNLFNHEIKVTISIGVSLYPKDGHDTDLLLSNADIAMLRAKKEGRNEFQFYNQDMNSFTIQQIEFETQLHKAVEEGQLVLYYQPIVDLSNNKILGVEALVRWKHPKRGLVLPLEFISIAEEIGLIQSIGDWVILTACHQAAIWNNNGLEDLKMSINISGHQFKCDSLVPVIINAIKTTDVNPTNLVLELTESVLISGSEEVRDTLKKLTAMGISISIDDFGTGYSSFSYVKRFPVNNLKIDRAFISDSISNEEDMAIVKAIIAMGKSLNFAIIAEGIENQKQLELLKSLNCEQGQGFYFSKPLSADDCTDFINKFNK